MQVLLHFLDAVQLLQLVIRQLRKQETAVGHSRPDLGSEPAGLLRRGDGEEEGWYLYDGVSQQPQVSVSHGSGTHQNLTVMAVVPLIVHRHDDPAEGDIHRCVVNPAHQRHCPTKPLPPPPVDK